MAKLEQLKLAEEFIRTILPGDMYYKLFKSEADQIIKVWKNIGKALDKNKPLKYNPSLSPEAKKYLKRYSKSVAFSLMDLRKKVQMNTIVPVETEFEKTEVKETATESEPKTENS